MKEKIFNEKNLTMFIVLSILIFPLLELIGMFFERQFFMQEQALSLIGVIGIIAITIHIVYMIKSKNIVLSDIFLITSILFCIISIVFSKNIKISLKGHPNYSETPLQVMGYFTLFLLATNISKKQNKKIILNTFLILAIIEATVAFMQNFSIWPVTAPFDGNWHTKDHLAFGFTQHCNYFAAVAIIFTGLFSGKFIYAKNKKENILTYIGSILCCFSILFTYTRIGWAGILTILFVVFVLDISEYLSTKDKLALKNNIRKTIILFIGFLVCFLLTGIPTKHIEKDITESVKELNSSFDEFGTKRGIIWRVGIDALMQYPLTGVGFDIYDFAFLVSSRKTTMFQSKGHNEYLHTAVTQGVFSGINYLAFCIYCALFAFIKILKGDKEYGKSDLTKILLIAITAYFAQAMFNSSVTNVAIYKWILMGLILTKVEQKNLTPILFRKI